MIVLEEKADNIHGERQHEKRSLNVTTICEEILDVQELYREKDSPGFLRRRYQRTSRITPLFDSTPDPAKMMIDDERRAPSHSRPLTSNGILTLWLVTLLGMETLALLLDQHDTHPVNSATTLSMPTQRGGAGISAFLTVIRHFVSSVTERGGVAAASNSDGSNIEPGIVAADLPRQEIQGRRDLRAVKRPRRGYPSLRILRSSQFCIAKFHRAQL